MLWGFLCGGCTLPGLRYEWEGELFFMTKCYPCDELANCLWYTHAAMQAGVGTVALVAGFLIATWRQMSHFEFIHFENCGKSSAVNQNNQD